MFEDLRSFAAAALSFFDFSFSHLVGMRARPKSNTSGHTLAHTSHKTYVSMVGGPFIQVSSLQGEM